MYTDYWRLHRRPFDNVPDERFYVPTESHEATRVKLRYAIEHRAGAALVCGPSGVGKSLLVESLLADLPESFGPRVHVRFSQLSPSELLAFIAEELTGRQPEPATMDRSLQRVLRTLAKASNDERHAVLVIDEAQLLAENDALETVRQLINFEPRWTVLLVAQPPLLPVLERTPELEERLSVQCLLRPLTADGTAAYLHHRLEAAGGEEAREIFAAEAVEVVHRVSEGIPRRINRLADLALLIGYAEEQRRITAEHVRAVAEELVASAPSGRLAA